MKNTLAIVSASLLVAGSLSAGSEHEQSKAGHQDHYSKSEAGKYQKLDKSAYRNRLQTSDILDAKVLDANNKDIGDVTDIELSRDGEIEALYVELDDGVLGLFGNTVVRVQYDDFDFNQEKGEFQIKESFSEQFTQFVSSFLEETKDAVDYAADNTEKGLRSLVNDLENDEACAPHMENVSIEVQDDKVYVRGKVDSEKARDTIVDRVEDNTRLEVVDRLEISGEIESDNQEIESDNQEIESDNHQ